MHALFDPWTHGFMQRALLELVLVGVVGAAIGCWVLFYELSYGAESLAHALFPGLVGAALLGVPLLLGGAIGVLVAAVGVALVGRIRELDSDTGVAVVVTGLFGLGALLALAPATPPGLSGLLFGDVLGVSDTDLAATAALALPVAVALRLAHRQLLVVGFDRSSAPALGGRPLLADIALLGLLALTIVIGVQALGNLLVVAMIVAPAACARLVTRRMLPMMATAAAIAAASSIAGLELSYHASTAAGASVAAVLVGAYLLMRAAVVVKHS